MKHEFSQQIFEKYLHTKFHQNTSSGSRVVPCGRTDRQMDTTKISHRFSHFCERDRKRTSAGITVKPTKRNSKMFNNSVLGRHSVVPNAPLSKYAILVCRQACQSSLCHHVASSGIRKSCVLSVVGCSLPAF